MSSEELNKGVKLFQSLTLINIVAILGMTLLSVWGIIQKGFDFWTAMPLFFLPSALFTVIRLKQLQAELRSRQ